MGEYLYFGSAILSIANGAVLLWLNPRRTVNRTFFLSCLCIGLWCTCVAMAIRESAQDSVNQSVLNNWLRLSSAVGAFLCWFIWLSKEALTGCHSSMPALVRQSWHWFLVSCGIAAMAFTEAFIPEYATQSDPSRGAGYTVYALAILLICTWFLVDASRRSAELQGIRKLEIRYFVINSSIACIVVVAAHVLSFYGGHRWLRRASLISLPFVHCSAIWAICHHRVFDAKQLGISYGQRIVLFSSIGISCVLLSRVIAGILSPAFADFLILMLACGVTVGVDAPLRRWLGLDHDQLLVAPRQAIIDAARKITNEAELKEEYARLFRQWHQTSTAVLISSESEGVSPNNHATIIPEAAMDYLASRGWATPESVQRSQPGRGTMEIANLLWDQRLGALIAAPKGSNPPSLIVGLGTRASLRPYSYSEIRMILNIVELIDNILAHARAAANAAKAEKLAAAAMMSRGLAHDLNNLATPVASFLSHVGSRVSPDSSEAQVLGDAQNALRVMQEYIRESLFFSRELCPSIETIRAEKLLHSVLRLGESRRGPARIRVTAKVDEDFQFAADPALMRRLLQNLIFNAIDASPLGCLIEVSARIDTDQRVSLAVADEGPGIPIDLQEKIFEPYFTTKNTGTRQRGLGLGLAICQKIAELHGAEITVRSRAPRGSVFVVTLPPAAPKPRQSLITGLGHISPAAVHEIAPNPTSA